MNAGIMKQKLVDYIKQPTYVFLFFSVIFGVIFVFLTPPFQSPDEQAHFFRAYQISDLHAHGSSEVVDGIRHYGGSIPKSVYQDTLLLKGDISGHPNVLFDASNYRKTIGDPLLTHDRQFVAFEGTEIYSPVPYTPQVIGIDIGKIFSLSPLALLWIGRLFNLAAWIGCIYITLRIIPIAKWGVVILALNPLALFQAASVSADALTTGSIFVLIGLLTYFMKRDSRLSVRGLAVICSIAVLIPLMKPTNILLCILIFLLPRNGFSTFKKYILYCSGTFIASLVIMLAWNYSVSNIINDVPEIFQPGAGVSTHGQVRFIFTHPLNYASNLINNYAVGNTSNGDAVLRSYNGTFGWLDSSIPLWTVLLQANALLLALMYQMGRGIALFRRQKLLIAALLFVSALGIITSLYVGYTKVGANYVGGLQGRYFIPISVLLILLFTGRKIVLSISEKSMGILMSSATLITLSVTSITLFIRYYG